MWATRLHEEEASCQSHTGLWPERLDRLLLSVQDVRRHVSWWCQGVLGVGRWRVELTTSPCQLSLYFTLADLWGNRGCVLISCRAVYLGVRQDHHHGAGHELCQAGAWKELGVH